MSRYAYGGDPPGMEGKYHYGVGSIGIPGSLIAADGFMGLSITLPADADKEYYAVIPAIPAGLTFDDGEAGDFDASAPDGTYVMPWDFYEWGVKLGSTSTTFKFGTGTVVNLAISNLAIAYTLSTLSVGVPNAGATLVSSDLTLTPALAALVRADLLITPGLAALVRADLQLTATLQGADQQTVTIPAYRTVTFEGGKRTVTFPGGKRTVEF